MSDDVVPIIDVGPFLAGDPQSRYRCTGGVGTDRMVCPDGCVIATGSLAGNVASNA